MEYTIQQAKDEAVKYCTKDFPVYTYEYDGAGGSMCYIRKDIAEKMAELYASKLREADQAELSTLREENERLRKALQSARDLLYYKDEENGGWWCDPMGADFGSVLTTIDVALHPSHNTEDNGK
jgi:predicted lipoprotein with Yx(FWY)xxD motif